MSFLSQNHIQMSIYFAVSSKISFVVSIFSIHGIGTIPIIIYACETGHRYSPLAALSPPPSPPPPPPPSPPFPPSPKDAFFCHL